jgi:ATP-binding cassette subfamily C protein LapB
VFLQARFNDWRLIPARYRPCGCYPLSSFIGGEPGAVANSEMATPQRVSVVAIAASTTIHILALAVPLAMFQAYDRILPSQVYGTTLVLAVGVMIAILLEAILRYSRALLFAYVGWSFDTRMTVQLVHHVMRADSKAVRRLGTPVLIDAIRAVGQVRDHWSGNAATALHELPLALIYILLIAYIGSWLALIPLMLTLLALVAALAVVRSTASTVRELEAAQSDCRNLAWGIFTGIHEAKTMAAEIPLTARYRDAVARVMDRTAKVESRWALIAENGALLAQISTIAVVTFGAFMVVAGELTTGGLAACTLLAGLSLGPTMNAFQYLSRRTEKREAEAKLSRVLELPPAPLWASEAACGQRQFQGGTLVLSGEAVRGGSASIPQGTFVHIDAPDSLAATAALRAVARLDDSLALDVSFDAAPSEAYDPLSLRRGITKSSSPAELIRGSLLDNLTLFSPQYEAEAIQLSERLGLSSFVDGLREGYLTRVGPIGADIVSPGMAARIDLIRALVRQPWILCLDQADSMLDLDGVKRLIELLKELKGNTTVLMVSGNPSLLALADARVRVEPKKAS